MSHPQFKSILLTNDDGIKADGLILLEKIASLFSDDIWIIAPHQNYSGASSCLSIGRKVLYEKHAAKKIAIEGSPTDCIIAGVNYFMPEPPDLILSGVNAGLNNGDKTRLSGTIGAALTGLSMNIPSLSISQERFDQTKFGGGAPWKTTKTILPNLLSTILQEGWDINTCLSINIPNLPPNNIKGHKWASKDRKNIKKINATSNKHENGQHYLTFSIQGQPAKDEPNNETNLLKQGFVTIIPLRL